MIESMKSTVKGLEKINTYDYVVKVTPYVRKIKAHIHPMSKDVYLEESEDFNVLYYGPNLVNHDLTLPMRLFLGSRKDDKLYAEGYGDTPGRMIDRYGQVGRSKYNREKQHHPYVPDVKYCIIYNKETDEFELHEGREKAVEMYEQAQLDKERELGQEQIDVFESMSKEEKIETVRKMIQSNAADFEDKEYTYVDNDTLWVDREWEPGFIEYIIENYFEF